MKNTKYKLLGFQHIELSIPITFPIIDIFQNFKAGIERQIAKLNFLSLHQIPKIFILKVTIEAAQGALIFWMPARFKVNI